MRCRKVKRFLSPYIDRELDKKTITVIEKHVHTCSHCKAELDSLFMMKRVISQKERLTVNEAFLSRLKTRLKKRAHLIRLRWIVETGNLARRVIPIPLMVMILIMTLIYSRLTDSSPVNDYIYEALTNTEVIILMEHTDSSVLLTEMIFKD